LDLNGFGAEFDGDRSFSKIALIYLHVSSRVSPLRLFIDSLSGLKNGSPSPSVKVVSCKRRAV
jgi:hypothetical protein